MNPRESIREQGFDEKTQYQNPISNQYPIPILNISDQHPLAKDCDDFMSAIYGCCPQERFDKKSRLTLSDHQEYFLKCKL